MEEYLLADACISDNLSQIYAGGRRVRVFVPFLLIVICLCGCSNTEERLNSLEKENRALMAELENVKTALDLKSIGNTGVSVVPVKNDKVTTDMDEKIKAMMLKAVNEQIDAAVAAQSDKINQMVAAKIEAQIGKPEEIGTIFQEVVEETMKEAEEKRREEREKKQKEWSEQMEQRRIQRSEEEVARMTEKLKLNTDQVDKVREILASQEDARRSAMRGMHGGGVASMPDRMDEMAVKNDSAMREVLNEEQFKVYQAEQEEKYNWIYNVMGRGGRPRVPYREQ